MNFSWRTFEKETNVALTHLKKFDYTAELSVKWKFAFLLFRLSMLNFWRKKKVPNFLPMQIGVHVEITVRTVKEL